jgi:hypothetical protein
MRRLLVNHMPCLFVAVLNHAADKVNLSGAANHWAMVQHLRPYVFQVGIIQVHDYWV